MVDSWLQKINHDPDSVLCQSAKGTHSRHQFRERVIELQSRIGTDGRKKWILYSGNGFEFVCGLIALLSHGRDVIIPGNNRDGHLKSLMDDGTGVIGNLPEECFGLKEASWEPESECSSMASVGIELHGLWGNVTFCTSGSSGKSKLITRSANQLFSEVDLFARSWQPDSETLTVPCVPHFHVYGLTFGYLLPLFTGGCFYISDKSGLLGAIDPVFVSKHNPVKRIMAVVSPSFARQLPQIEVQADANALTGPNRPGVISRVFCAGGKLSTENAGLLIEKLDCPVTEIYGSTETGAVASRLHTASRHGESVAWEVLPDIHVKVVDEDAGDDAKSGTGTACFWGGHIDDSEQAAISPGDRIRLLDSRQFELLGRNSQICKIEGKRISIAHFIELLERCDWVEWGIACPSERKGKELLLCGVVLSSAGVESYLDAGKYRTDQKIRQYLLQHIDPVLVPRRFTYLDFLPESDMAKIPRDKLMELLVDPVPQIYPIVVDKDVQSDQVRLTLSIPMDLSYLKGHFNTRPIVPGLILLDWVYVYAREFLGIEPDPAAISQLKFSQPVRPGLQLSLELKNASGTLSFLYSAENDQRFSSGRIALLEA